MTTTFTDLRNSLDSLGRSIDALLAERDALRARVATLEVIVNRLVHLDARLRLRSPATAAEITVWAELRAAARAALAGEASR